MNNKGGLSGYSPEQMNTLAKLLTDTKQLMQQQEALIEKVLAGEEKIGQKRVSYLEEYNEGYSKLLNLVSDQCKSLNSDFITLHKQIAESYKAIDDLKNRSNKDGSSTENSSKQPRQQGSKQAATQVNNEATKELNTRLWETNRSVQGLTNVAAELRDIIKAVQFTPSIPAEAPPAKVDTDTTENSTGVLSQDILAKMNSAQVVQQSQADSNQSMQYTPSHDEVVAGIRGIFAATRYGTQNGGGSELAASLESSGSVAVGDTISESERAGMREIANTDSESQLDFSNEISNEDKLAKLREENTKKHLKDLREAAEKYHQAELELARIRELDAEELENKKLEVRIAKLNEATKAEIEAQNFINDIEAEIAYTNADPEAAAEVRARAVNAKEELASRQELAKKTADWAAKEERKARIKYSGEELKSKLASIEKERVARLKADQSNLDKVTKLRQIAEEKAQRDREKSEKKARVAAGESAKETIFGKGVSIRERIDAFKDLTLLGIKV